MNCVEVLRIRRFYAIIYIGGDDMKCIFDLLLRKKHIEVLEVLQLNNYFYVKPKKGSYEMIYRAARGVYWDEDRSSLFKGVTTRENALKTIAEAMKDEYGITLIFN